MSGIFFFIWCEKFYERFLMFYDHSTFIQRKLVEILLSNEHTRPKDEFRLGLLGYTGYEVIE